GGRGRDEGAVRRAVVNPLWPPAAHTPRRDPRAGYALLNQDGFDRLGPLEGQFDPTLLRCTSARCGADEGGVLRTSTHQGRQRLKGLAGGGAVAEHGLVR